MQSPHSYSAQALQHLATFRAMVRTALADPAVTESFETLSTFIQSPATLKSALLLLKESRHDAVLAKPSPRTLLASLMVTRFPLEILEVTEEEMSTSAHDLDRNCFALASELVAIVIGDDTDLTVFLTALSSFQVKFAEWKEYDRQRILRSLASTHHQWAAGLEHLEASRATTRDPESLAVMIESVQREMANNKRRILQMGGPDALEQVVASPPIAIDLNQILEEVGSRRYWDEFTNELRRQPPVYDRVNTLLSEIRDRLKQLVPTRSDLQHDMDRAIDVDFIQQMIAFGSFDGAAFFNVFDVIWTQLKTFGSAAAEPEWIEWRDHILARAHGAQVGYDVLLPEIFNRFLLQLDRIEDLTRRYREMMAGNTEIPAPSSA